MPTNDESTGYAWAPIDAPPQPLHPGVLDVLRNIGWRRSRLASDGALLAYDRLPAGVLPQSRFLRPGLAFDRATVRKVDQNGRLHVEVCNISKANICPYLGREIPGGEEIGLDPDKIYQLLRDPDELAKAAPTFNNLPLLSEHVPVDINDHQPDLVIGSTGTDAEFVRPYLRNSLVVWEKKSFEGILDASKKELSSAYAYRADMTPGVYDGAPYDGVMRDIVGNHVALVKEGRAGADVVVGDSKETISMSTKAKKLRGTAAVAAGALIAYLKPKLAADAQIDVTALVSGLTRKNFAARKPALVAAVDKAVAGKLAQDASVEDLAMLLDTLEAHPDAAVDDEPLPIKTEEQEAAAIVDPPLEDKSMDAEHPLKSFLQGKLSEDDYVAAMDMLKASANDAEAGGEEKLKELGAADADDDDDEKDDKKAADEPPPFKGKPEVGGGMDEEKDKDMVDKKAMDAAISAAVRKATTDALKLGQDIREAERVVRPYVGDLQVAFDSADAVYAHALKALGVKVDGVHPSAFKAILDAQPKPGAKKIEVSTIAQDAKSAATYAERFPDAARVRVIG